VTQDQYLSFGVRGAPTQPENASDDRVEERVEHGGGCYENAGRRGESSFRARQAALFVASLNQPRESVSVHPGVMATAPRSPTRSDMTGFAAVQGEEAGRTFAACGPYWPCVTSYSTSLLLLEVAVSATRDRSEVHEHICAAVVGSDEAETLLPSHFTVPVATDDPLLPSPSRPWSCLRAAGVTAGSEGTARSEPRSVPSIRTPRWRWSSPTPCLASQRLVAELVPAVQASHVDARRRATVRERLRPGRAAQGAPHPGRSSGYRRALGVVVPDHRIGPLVIHPRLALPRT